MNSPNTSATTSTKAPAYLPEGYKRRVHWTEKGRARTGHASPKGVVLQGEHWDGSLDAKVRTPAVVANVKDTLETAGIAWTIITLPNGRQVCLPKRVLDMDNPLDNDIIRRLTEANT